MSSHFRQIPYSDSMGLKETQLALPDASTSVEKSGHWWKLTEFEVAVVNSGEAFHPFSNVSRLHVEEMASEEPWERGRDEN